MLHLIVMCKSKKQQRQMLIKGQQDALYKTLKSHWTVLIHSAALLTYPCVNTSDLFFPEDLTNVYLPHVINYIILWESPLTVVIHIHCSL